MTTPPPGSREAADGGAAFACASVDGYQSGMSLRDWFAGQALAGVILLCKDDSLSPADSRAALFAWKAYAIADEMLSARGETK